MESLYQLLKSDNGYLKTLHLDDASSLAYHGAKTIAKGYFRTKTLRSLSLLNAKINTDSAAFMLDNMLQSGLEELLLRNNGTRLVETYKQHRTLPNIDNKVLKQIIVVGERNKKNRIQRELQTEL